MFSGVTVKQYMSSHLVTFSPGQDILEVAGVLLEKRISGAPVVDKRGNLVGVLSEKDCLEALLKARYHEDDVSALVKDVMSTQIQTVDVEDNLVDVARRFVNERYKRYPVLRDNLLVGQISRRDVLRGLREVSTRVRKAS